MTSETSQPNQPAASATGNLVALAAVIATATLFGFTYSLTSTVIALDLAALGASSLEIGANAASHAVGVLLVALILPRLVARFGIRPLLILALLASALLLPAFPLLARPALWFVLRLALGMVSEILFVLSETWANSLASDKTRARTMAAYTACLSTGFALGPLVLSLIGSTGFRPYLLAAAVALCATGLILSPAIRAPLFEAPRKGGLGRLVRLAPLALSTSVLNAAIESAGLSFLALYAIRLGWPEAGATGLMACMMAGAILLQLPIGWLADRVDRRKLLIALSGLATLGALAWPLAIAQPYALYGLLFAWGGVFVGIYTVMLALIGSRFSNTDLVGIYAGMGLMWGLGAFAGPLFAGVAMQAAQHGLALFAALACSLFLLAAWRLPMDGATEPAERI